MSSQAEHLNQANKNQAVLEHLLQDPVKCDAWIAVVAFYKALHVVEAIFSTDPAIGHTSNHHVRLDKIKKTKKYANLHPSYRVLWSAALIARYLSGDIQTASGSASRTFSRFEDYMSVRDLRDNLLGRYLVDFERKALSFLPSIAPQLVCYHSAPEPQAAPPPISPTANPNS